MDKETKMSIGLSLYFMSIGMIIGQLFFYLTNQLHSQIPTLLATIFIIIGMIFRSK